MKSHDLHLPSWGPYTKKYIGISHIADPVRGWRFDLSVAPGFYRRKIDLPNVLWESGYHPWEAAPDLEYYCHRHELEWKDRIYCDIAFAKEDGSSRFIRCECVNETDTPQGIVLHLLASLNFPAERRANAALPAKARWINALGYRSFTYGKKRPADGMASDLMMRGEIRGQGFTSGSGLAFGRTHGDSVVYDCEVPEPMTDAVLLLRYRSGKSTAVQMQFGNHAPHRVEFPSTGDNFAIVSIPLGSLPVGKYSLECTALETACTEWDGLVFVESPHAQEVNFELETRNPRPQQIAGPCPNTLLLQYDGLEQTYGIAWNFPNFRIREFLTDDLDCLMPFRVHDHVSKVLKGKGEGQYTDIYLHPLVLSPHSRQTVEALICCGSRDDVMASLAAFDPDNSKAKLAFQTAQSKAALPKGTPSGKEFEFSQARMSATTLMNVVYPTYARRSFIRHNTPGRWWDSLYTWDSGFIGLGLLELDRQRAVDCLNAYLTEVGDPHAAFVHHGSPVPVQHYLFQQLWNRTGSQGLLNTFYPGLRQYHHFLTGRDLRSNTRRLKSGMLQTWDYFYNSGGWDDYPPQQYIHDHQIAGAIATVCNTAHAIRTAKILRMVARELGIEEDILEYDEDIDLFSSALQAHAWDEDSGYFGYVRHNANQEPEEILRHPSGANFNMGLDGISPLIAGICTPTQRQRILEHLGSSTELWSPIGLSTVDQSAPYYREDGYWNGAVWMPHQWFIWRALLDLGEAELAFRIAHTALQLWSREVGTSYNCFEHFIVKTGRGAGWHQFSGLSTPVLCWFASYYIPGHLTGGLDTWIHQHQFSPDHTSLNAELYFDTLHDSPVTLLAVMNPAFHYHAKWEGHDISVHERSAGTLELTFTPQSCSGRLEVIAVQC